MVSALHFDGQTSLMASVGAINAPREVKNCRGTDETNVLRTAAARADLCSASIQRVSSVRQIYEEADAALQPADIGWPTGNGKKVSNSQACCLAQLCLAAA